MLVLWQAWQVLEMTFFDLVEEMIEGRGGCNEVVESS